MRAILATILGLLAGAGCSSDDAEAPETAADPGTLVMMDHELGDGFFSAPLPSEARRDAAGRVDVSAFPNPTHSPFLGALLDMLHDARGFGTTSGVFFQTSAPLDEAQLPDLEGSTGDDANVFLIGVDAGAPDYLERYPVEVEFAADGGPFGSSNLLSLLPLQGRPLLPDTTYAAVVLRAVPDADGQPLGVSPQMAALASGKRPAGIGDAAFESYRAALDVLEQAGTPAGDIAGLSVFRTGDPTAELARVRDAVLQRPLPVLAAPFAQTELFDEYCVYESRLPMPVYQAGQPPFDESGGGWAFDDAGEPVLQAEETARIVVTVPRAAMPTEGYPIVLFSRTGGGGDRPLVDRGVRAEPGGAVLEPGSGPALYFSRAGFAGASVDGPHGGLRNVTGGDEQFLMFNVGNPLALRDNVRQSAVELILQAHLLGDIQVDSSDCPGAAPTARFDTGTLALMGHSMGATISPLAVALEPRFRALLLSGAGGSWIENVVHKQSPLAVKGFAELLLGVAGQYALHEHDPALSLFQWAAESADPPAYARALASEPRHVLMMQGIVDTYILPPIANATSLSLGLDLAGESLDTGHPELADFTPLGELLRYSGARAIALPAAANGAGGRTCVVVQHAEGPVEDGHEVVFQTEPPKHQYQCFLQSMAATDSPLVAEKAGVDAPCP